MVLFASCSNAHQLVKSQDQALLTGSATLTEPLYRFLVAAFWSRGTALLTHMVRMVESDSVPHSGCHRGFNEAVNAFADEKWVTLPSDGMDDVSVMARANSDKDSGVGGGGGVLCARASMLLQIVPPSTLVRFMHDHRSEWADPDIDASTAAAIQGTMRRQRKEGDKGLLQADIPLAVAMDDQEVRRQPRGHITGEGHRLSAWPSSPDLVLSNRNTPSRPWAEDLSVRFCPGCLFLLWQMQPSWHGQLFSVLVCGWRILSPRPPC